MTRRRTARRSTRSTSRSGREQATWPVPVVDFPGLLEQRKQWLTRRAFFIEIAEPFLAMKTWDYVWRVFRRHHAEIHVWDQAQTLPTVTGTLTPVAYFIRVSRSSSATVLDMHRKAILQGPERCFWWVETVPEWPESVWQALQSVAMVVRQPAIAPSAMSDWLRRLARAYRLSLTATVAGRFARAVLYDPVFAVQILENLALQERRGSLQWADIEPFLPETVRVFPAEEIMGWIRRKHYSTLLEVVARLQQQRPDLDVMLRQMYTQWRAYVLAGQFPEYDPVLWKRFGIGRRYWASVYRDGAALHLHQWQQWAEHAAWVEQTYRKTGHHASHLMTIALLRWLRIIA